MTAIVHRNKDRFAGAGPSRQPFQSGHTIFFQDEEQLAMEISQPPLQFFQVFSHNPTFSFLSYKLPSFYTAAHSWNPAQILFFLVFLSTFQTFWSSPVLQLLFLSLGDTLLVGCDSTAKAQGQPSGGSQLRFEVQSQQPPAENNPTGESTTSSAASP